MTMLHLNMTLFWYPNYPQRPTMSARRRRQEAQASVGARPDLDLRNCIHTNTNKDTLYYYIIYIYIYLGRFIRKSAKTN